MTGYQVLARKYRPATFGAVVGQEPIVATLLNAMKMGRVAHAYLFCGTRGTGKTTLARLFAKALNCKQPTNKGEPCTACASCKDIAAGRSLDVLEIDGASHRGIEDIRQINETVGYAPSFGACKIYIIDEVHMLTKEAFNALLKTLEEPPSNVKFFFATTEPHKVPPTILSRCQRFNLSRISQEKIEAKLSEIARDLGRECASEALALIAQLAEGSLRDAESLFDQALAYTEERLTVEAASEVLGITARTLFFALDEAGAKRDYAAAFTIAEQVLSSGKNLWHFVQELTKHFRTLLFLKTGGTSKSQDAYTKSLNIYSPQQCLDILEMLAQAQEQIRHAPSEAIALEMLLLRILRTHQRIPLESLIERLEKLEKGGAEPTKAQPATPSSLENFAKCSSGDAGSSRAGEAASPRQSGSKAPAAPTQPPPKAEAEKREPTSKPQYHYDTLMQFAAKELGGSLKKES